MKIWQCTLSFGIRNILKISFILNFTCRMKNLLFGILLGCFALMDVGVMKILFKIDQIMNSTLRCLQGMICFSQTHRFLHYISMNDMLAPVDNAPVSNSRKIPWTQLIIGIVQALQES